jgi:hypothetical protein
MLSRVLALTAMTVALGACAATNTDTRAVDWNRPFQPAAGSAPVFLHNMAIANQPYPRDVYANFWEEPTRFEFRPRNVIYEDDTDNGTGAVEEGGDMGGGEE